MGMGGAETTARDPRRSRGRTWTVPHALLAMLAARLPQRHAKDVKIVTLKMRARRRKTATLYNLPI